MNIMNIKKRDYIYKLNEHDITVEMKIVCFDGEEDHYLVIFRPYMLMVYNGVASMVTHVSIDIGESDKWLDSSSEEIKKDHIDPKIKSRIYAEILLD